MPGTGKRIKVYYLKIFFKIQDQQSGNIMSAYRSCQRIKGRNVDTNDKVFLPL